MGGVAVGRGTIHGLRPGRGLPARDAGQAAGRRRRDPARRAAPRPGPVSAGTAATCCRGPGGTGRSVGDRAAADRYRDRCDPARRLDVPRPGAAAPRPLPHRRTGPTAATGPTGLVRPRVAALRLGGPRRLRRRAAAGAHPARRRGRRAGCSATLRPWRIDLAFPARRWRSRSTVGLARRRRRFRDDRRKQNALVRAGWDPLRFTWHDLDGRPAAVLAEVRDTLAAAA